MKKLIDFRCLVAIGDSDFCDTSICDHIRYVEMEDGCSNTEYYYATFADAHEAVKRHMIRNAKTDFTLFRGRPTINIRWNDGDIYRTNVELTEKTFKPIRVKWEMMELTKWYSIKDLADLLPADQFCEWLKDQGIMQISTF